MKLLPLEFEKPIIELEEKLADLKKHTRANDINFDAEVLRMEEKIQETKRVIYENLTAWQRVQIARHPARPFTLDYLQLSFAHFLEVHGDRLFAEDRAMPGGFAQMGGRKCVVIGHQKGRELKENLKRNFGCANPEGYRKAMRIMRLAEKFHLPVFTFVDTPGAFPGIDAEDRNQSEAIGHNLYTQAELKVPIITTIIGEGGSGGALAIAMGDMVMMLQYSTYSVISPEGCASILWKTAEKAPDAAEQLALTAQRLKELNLIDSIVPEPIGGAHRNYEGMMQSMNKVLKHALSEVGDLAEKDLLDRRHKRFMSYGQFKEVKAKETN